MAPLVATGGAQDARAPPASRTVLLGGPAVVDLLQRRGLVLLARGEGDHALPEAAGADLSGDAVRPVEADARGGVGDLGDRAGRLVAVLADVEVLVRREEPAVLRAGPRRAEGRVLGDVLQNLGHVAVALGEQRGHVTATLDGVRGALGEGGHADLAVDGAPHVLGEEALLADEVALL